MVGGGWRVDERWSESRGKVEGKCRNGGGKAVGGRWTNVSEGKF